jgi:hypothetical protein
MKGSGGAFLVALVLAALGAACLAAGLIDRRVVSAQREFAARRYAQADATLEGVERYLGYGRWMPWIGGTLADIRTERAAMRYWSGQYDRVVADQSDPLGEGTAESIELQLIAANAVYRRGQPGATSTRAAV